MHDARPAYPADPRQAVATMGEQRVDQRAVGIARCGMDDQTGGFAQDENLRVLTDLLEYELHREQRREVVRSDRLTRSRTQHGLRARSMFRPTALGRLRFSRHWNRAGPDPDSR